MIRLHLIEEIEKERKIQNCNINFKKIEQNFNDCLKNNNNKNIECQDARSKLEECYRYIKIIKQK